MQINIPFEVWEDNSGRIRLYTWAPKDFRRKEPPRFVIGGYEDHENMDLLADLYRIREGEDPYEDGWEMGDLEPERAELNVAELYHKELEPKINGSQKLINEITMDYTKVCDRDELHTKYNQFSKTHELIMYFDTFSSFEWLQYDIRKKTNYYGISACWRDEFDGKLQVEDTIWARFHYINDALDECNRMMHTHRNIAKTVSDARNAYEVGMCVVILDSDEELADDIYPLGSYMRRLI